MGKDTKDTFFDHASDVCRKNNLFVKAMMGDLLEGMMVVVLVTVLVLEEFETIWSANWEVMCEEEECGCSDFVDTCHQKDTVTLKVYQVLRQGSHFRRSNKNKIHPVLNGISYRAVSPIARELHHSNLLARKMCWTID